MEVGEGDGGEIITRGKECAGRQDGVLVKG